MSPDGSFFASAVFFKTSSRSQGSTSLSYTLPCYRCCAWLPESDVRFDVRFRERSSLKEGFASDAATSPENDFKPVECPPFFFPVSKSIFREAQAAVLV